MEILRGNFLINTKQEAVIANEIFRDFEYVGLYFSASWCPPSQTFLPQLKAMHEEAQSRQVKLEIIFVPSDSDNQRMTRFFLENHGPWYALPVGPLAVELRRKMQIFSIPSLVVLSNKGKLVTRSGREDLEGCENPFETWFSSSDKRKNES
ncbi:hypothetical protein TSAR_002591 [Trichomalopsis sarcophagae]|uniref:Thioredoxin domain-containing protein n=1 Tax=Trichomalopsis sarcophagae TaxID=543379 RepID=A0A232F1A1_9HYME|nr:hypothetical protein TSAR_002591 [Trichomalopsis sarcophagae]